MYLGQGWENSQFFLCLEMLAWLYLHTQLLTPLCWIHCPMRRCDTIAQSLSLFLLSATQKKMSNRNWIYAQCWQVLFFISFYIKVLVLFLTLHCHFSFWDPLSFINFVKLNVSNFIHSHLQKAYWNPVCHQRKITLICK